MHACMHENYLWALSCMVWALCQTPRLNRTCRINLLAQDMEKLRQDLEGVGSLRHCRERGFLWCSFHPEHDRSSSKLLQSWPCMHTCMFKESWPRFTGITVCVSPGLESAIVGAECSGRSSKEPVESWSQENITRKYQNIIAWLLKNGWWPCFA